MEKNTDMKRTIVKYRTLSFLIMLSLLLISLTSAQEWKSVLELRGKWKFQMGDEKKWAEKSFNDSKWDEVFVPSPWEDEGFPGYDGYAWYRKHFNLPSGTEKKVLYLRLGCVDDVGEVYFNGTLIGISGSFPPDYYTAYNSEIVLPLPQNILNVSGDNVIAVRVYDDQLAGGIVQGKIGLFESIDNPMPEISFNGIWQFKTGDSDQWKDTNYDDRSWNKIFVPAVWESQGYSYYDGFAWYRFHFKVPAELVDKTLVLLLGKIDDLDETYINGELIGRTGRIRSNTKSITTNDEYQRLREYTIPSGVLKSGADNTIAVRVFDSGGFGGIYQGPTGIVTREQYKKWKKSRPWQERINEETKNIFDLIFE
ncbi:MAG: beta galactosidase jelly roll domain-containing protein [Ignavibacteriales bacterium]|nr:beta galactosidase jelly roll domain-containing protein [Ignavibacteriales bacterium]